MKNVKRMDKSASFLKSVLKLSSYIFIISSKKYFLSDSEESTNLPEGNYSSCIDLEFAKDILSAKCLNVQRRIHQNQYKLP